MDQVIELFSTPAGIYAYPEDLTREFNVVKDLEFILSDQNFTTEDKFILNKKEFETLHSFCLAAVNDYWNNILGYTGNLDIVLSWANRTKNSQSHHKHYHSNSIISGSFYFESIKNNPITLVNPIEKLKWYDVGIIEHNKFNGNTISLAMDKPGLIVFPSFIDHYVGKNNDDSDRYSLAFNTFFTEPIGSLENATYLGPEIDKNEL
jgi:hypothetical protein